MKQQFKISDTTECRIWECDFTGKYDLLTDFQQTVSDAVIGQISTVIIALDLLPERQGKMDRAQLQPLLLPDLKETGKELGRGAYGVVTEVIVSGTICAAKKLHPAIVQGHTLRRFGDEVLLHSQQRHPNIVQLIGVYYPSHSQLPMLVMEYLPLSLTQCLERAEELPLQMKYSILLDVAKGLCYLHGKRPPIVHRDLTANNVLLTSSYSAKISDLGVSRLADTFKKHHLTTAPGNAMVMPPEALEDNPVYDHKLDVFSYGCLILHVLTGQFPQPTNQFVQEPGRSSFLMVSEWDRRSSYIEDIPKENELLPLAKDCLTDESTGRPEMIECYQFVEQILSKYPKMKSATELMKDNEAAEKRICELDAEIKELKAEKIEKDKLEKQLTADNERLTGNYDQLNKKLKNILSQVTGLQNAHSLKEKEFNDSTRVLKEIIRSRDEQLVKQQEDNMELLKKREADLKEEHLIELAAMKEESEAKLLSATKKHDQQLSEVREECEVKVAEVVKEFMESSQTLKDTAAQQQSTPMTVGRNEAFITNSYFIKAGLESEIWFFPKLSRARAENILKQENKEGAFVVRISSQEKHYTLSICHKGQAMHYLIRIDEEKKYYIYNMHRFPTVTELIEYHKLNGGGLPTRLRQPPALLVPNQPALRVSSAFDDKWRIDKSELSLGKELGSGQFKRVVAGQWRNEVDVAIKIMEGALNEDDLIKEAILMQKFQHDNLVKLCGVCIRQRSVYIITELMVNGSLLQYLCNNQRLVNKTDILLDMAIQICATMKFLEQSGFIHRNLPARNCQVGYSNIVKVGGFSSARFVPDDEYEASVGVKYAVRWSPPEVITHARYSNILLWELWSGSNNPYPAFSNIQVLDQIERGYRLEKPKLCPYKVYALMRRSWRIGKRYDTHYMCMHVLP
uniref:Tyrosine-protein kinase n=1 Tax=Amphimedon queenslandica TaxID=400682 RepID=A0A1X7TCN4_AMPQE